MTDIEKFKQLMGEFNIPLTAAEPYLVTSEDKTLSIQRTTPETEKINGYSGFSADFVFSKDGSFISVGIWE